MRASIMARDLTFSRYIEHSVIALDLYSHLLVNVPSMHSCTSMKDRWLLMSAWNEMTGFDETQWIYCRTAYFLHTSTHQSLSIHLRSFRNMIIRWIFQFDSTVFPLKIADAITCPSQMKSLSSFLMMVIKKARVVTSSSEVVMDHCYRSQMVILHTVVCTTFYFSIMEKTVGTGISICISLTRIILSDYHKLAIVHIGFIPNRVNSQQYYMAANFSNSRW